MASIDPEQPLQDDPRTFPLPRWRDDTTEILSWERTATGMWFYLNPYDQLTPDCRTIAGDPDFPADNQRMLREKAVQVLQAMEGYGRNDNPAGRQAAYARLLALWGETEDAGGNIAGWKSRCGSNESSCGLVIRSLWRLLGCRHERLVPPYAPLHPKAVLQALPHIAHQAGALWPPLSDKCKASEVLLHAPLRTVRQFLGCAPQKGDVVYIYDAEKGRQHIFTITEHTVEETSSRSLTGIEHADGKRYIHRFVSIDGGQAGPGGDGGCCAIGAVRRTLQSDLTFEGSPRRIQYIIKLDRMVGAAESPLSAPILELICRLPRQAKAPQPDDSLGQPE